MVECERERIGDGILVAVFPHNVILDFDGIAAENLRNTRPIALIGACAFVVGVCHTGNKIPR